MDEELLSLVRDLLSYNSATGLFVWRKSRGHIAAGSAAGSRHASGYVYIGVNNRGYRAHRLAWLYHYGRWPAAQIDHINGIRDDNRIANLREATNAENMQNIRAVRAASGQIGVCWHKKAGKWMASIQKDGRQIYLGLHQTRELAKGAYMAAKQELHSFSKMESTQ